MPDTVAGRLLRVEERTARLGQSVEDLSRQLGSVVPLVRELGEVATELRGVKDDVSDVRADVVGIRTALEDRDKEATLERRSVRVALIGLTAVIIASLIAAVATIIASGVG